MSKNKTYWKGIEEKEQTPEFVEASNKEFSSYVPVEEFLSDKNIKETSTPRRDFLKFMGFSIAAATLAACEAPVIKAIPYVNKPEDITPGIANWYATTYFDGNDFANILVKTREGRPIYIKSNQHFGDTKTANPRILASVLSLYNSERLRNVVDAEGNAVSWDNLDAKVGNELKSIASRGGKIRILSSTIASPSTQKAINEFGSSLSGADFQHIEYDAISYSSIKEANDATFGKSVIPDYHFDKANVVVGVGADFLTNWLFSTDYISDYTLRRNPESGNMLKHFQFETVMTVTGASADYRTPIKPSDEAKVLAAIYKKLSGSSVLGVDSSDFDNHPKVVLAAQQLKENKGKSLVVAGANNLGVQLIANEINKELNNIGSTIDLDTPVYIKNADDRKVSQLVTELKAGKIDALLLYNTNPVYSMPNGNEIAEAIKKVDLSISFSLYADETSSNCKYICPDNHYLEAWNDYSPKKGSLAIAQPLIRPLHDTRQAQESLLVWAGRATREGKDSTVFYNYIKENIGSKVEWNTFVHNGSADVEVNTEIIETPIVEEMAPMTQGEQTPVVEEMPMASASLSNVSQYLPKFEGGLEIQLYQKVGLGDGSQCGNPWLLEMPDPVSKVTWDNYITMVPSEMKEKGLNVIIGQEQPASTAKVTVNGVDMTLPIYPSPGQAKGTIGIALGFGRGENDENIGKAAYQTDKYGDFLKEDGKRVPVGKNAFKFVDNKSNNISYQTSGSIELLDDTYPLACTQTHHTLMGRDSIVKETTLEVFEKGNKRDFNPPHELVAHVNGKAVKKPISDFDLWNEHPVENVGHRWGMVIDLSTCIGCGNCLISCQAENNVPVVGKDEVRRARDMHWIRLDRYYSSEMTKEKAEEEGIGTISMYRQMEDPSDNPEVVFMPMMCQHCNHAPCETVCPVVATTHSNEGLNQMTYNRCIGTRYCANNCPYKVRRFNWFNYLAYKKFDKANPAQDDLGRMVLNPDVTVRSRGVMEKCSMCVQSIQEGKLKAKKAGHPVKDGDIKTACAEGCPTDAIVFGDLNNTESLVRNKAKGDRSYNVLEEVGVKPNIYYQVKVRNKKQETV